MPIRDIRRAALSSGALIPWCLMMASAAAPAQAADAAAPPAATPAQPATVAEVVVTAERRSTNIQRTPLAITAVSSASLDKSNAEDIAVLTEFTPGLTITRAGAKETVPTIRGVGSNTPENGAQTGPGVSLFQDGVYIGDAISAGDGLFDVEHVEVMRGPQGTLYGVNSTGGAILIVSQAPKLNKYEALGDFSLGDYSYKRERVAVNLPLGDQFALRLSAQRLDHSGFTRNIVTGQDLDNSHTGDVKAALLWQPTDNFSATLSAQAFSQHDHGMAQKGINDTTSSPRQLSQDFNDKNWGDEALYRLNLKLDLPQFSVTSVTGYRKSHSDVAENVTFSTIKNFSPYEYMPRWAEEAAYWTEELDFLSPSSSKLKWIAGLFLMRKDGAAQTLEYQGASLSDPMPTTLNAALPAAQLPQDLVFGQDVTDKRDVIEPFVQLSYPILDNLHLTAGVRYNYEKHELTPHNYSKFGNQWLGKFTDSTKVPTWRAELDWDVTASSMLYASAATGYKTGGISGSSGATLVPRFFKPEQNTAFEVGSKNTFFDHHLRANFSGFYYLYKDMQYIETDPIPFNQGTANIPSTHIWGLEGELSYEGMDHHLHLGANFALEEGHVQGSTLTLSPALVNSLYVSIPECSNYGFYWNTTCWSKIVAARQNISGASPPDMPKFSGGITASYDFDVANGVLTPEVSLSHHGSQWARIFNQPGLDKVKDYDLLNFNLTYVPSNSHLKFSLAATNLANRAAVNTRYTSPYESGQTANLYVPPRQIIGTIAFKF